MKVIYTVLVVLFAAVDTGYSLQCYRCRTQNGQPYSSDQCEQNQIIETCIDSNYTCGHLRYKIDNVADEMQVKECKDDCSASLREQCNEIVALGGECEYSCCQQHLCNEDFNPDSVLMCYHCDGPFGNGSLGLNSSSAPNHSYTTSQCINEQRQVPCPNGRCSRFFRRFENKVVVEIRSCRSHSKCNKVSEFCAKENSDSAANTTKICQTICCDTDLCNSVPRVSFNLSLIVLTITFALLQI